MSAKHRYFPLFLLFNVWVLILIGIYTYLVYNIHVSLKRNKGSLLLFDTSKMADVISLNKKNLKAFNKSRAVHTWKDTAGHKGSQWTSASNSKSAWNTSKIYIDDHEPRSKIHPPQIVDQSINRSSYRITPKSRVYRWNDSDPNGWKHLPLMKIHPNLAQKKLDVDSGNSAVIYNRVSKTGSRYMLEILRKLAMKNSFNMISSIVYHNSYLTPQERKQMSFTLDQVKKPYVFERHMIHFHMSKKVMQSRPLPIYFSIIRDPLNRMVSMYNYMRFGDGTKTFNKSNLSNNTMDECIYKNIRVCSEEGSMKLIPIFCGNNPQCRKPTEWALERAINTAKNQFFFIGLTEELDNSLKLLEILLPNIFKGVVKLTRENHVAETAKITASKYSFTPSPKAEVIMRKRLFLEYRFYNFFKKQFTDLKKKYSIV